MTKKSDNTMTKEEKNELIVALCGYLPYGVKCYVPTENAPLTLTGRRLNYLCFHKDEWGLDYSHEFECVLDPLNDSSNEYIIKPYLRPMSSMTEDEYEEFKKLDKRSMHRCIVLDGIDLWFDKWEIIEWFNSHHFDYRRLIEKGLALQAPEGIYKFSDSTIGK